ncbi:MAG: zf-HC2 domain-containing protein [Gemmataceae bacterium]|nr:zf-HC2 domain-containing protein [Gemmata sp.]MDW8197314.1 zf-HC2 domain-containing protein [Gemmataceae bacterium]
MNCSELMSLLVDFLGGELVQERRETVELHIRACPRCEVYVASYTQTVKVARALPKCGRLPATFEARLRQLLEPELKARQDD